MTTHTTTISPETEASSASASAAAQGPRLFWSRFGWSALALLLITVSWVFVNPLGAAPDEGAHATTAYATAHGDIGNIYPTVPPVYVELGNRESLTLICHHAEWSITADCQDWEAATSGPMVTADTQFGTYNPVYYFLVGLPTLVLSDQAAIYAMRLVSAVLFSLVAAIAIALAATRPRGALSVGGVLAALTPTVFLLGGTINVNAIEIAAALVVWIGMLALLDRGVDTARENLVMTATTVGLVVLVITRLLSPLWLIAIVIAAVSVRSGWSRLWQLIVTSRRFQIHLGVVVVAGLYAVWWSLTHPAKFIAVQGPVDSLWQGIRQTVWNLTQDFWRRTFGEAIAYIDMISMPIYAAALVFAALWGGMLAASVLVARTRHEKAVLLLVPVVAIGFPAALEAFMWSGGGWQGRYSLPLLIGIPVLAAFVLVARAGHRADLTRIVGSGLLWAVIAVLTMNVFTLAIDYYRFGAGWGGPWNAFAFAWQPPLGPLPWFAATVVGSLVLVGIFRRAAAADAQTLRGAAAAA